MMHLISPPPFRCRPVAGWTRPPAAGALAVTLTAVLLGGADATLAQDSARGQPPRQEPVTALPGDQPEPTGVEAPPGSDLWAESRLETTYSLNELLNPFDIDVDVQGATVTLSGVVDSPAERELALRLAREVGGIDNVRDRLQVRPPGEAGPRVNPLYSHVQEANTSARVKLQLLWRKPVDGLLVDVTTRGNKVILTGTVGSEEAKQAAGRIARRTSGVAWVENHLTVDPDASAAGETGAATGSASERVSDAWLGARVLASLRFDRTIDAERIDVSVNNGVVTLSGQVPKAWDKREAAAVAGAIDGVQRVDNQIGVEDRAG